MYARSDRDWRAARMLAIALALLAPLSASAKPNNFDTGTPFGLGLQAGISARPKSDLVGSPQTSSRNFSNHFSFEPFLDFGNFAFRLTGQLHNLPTLSAGTGAGAYSETSETQAFLYGLQLVLAPYVAESRTHRAYFKLGIAKAQASSTNERKYLNAGGATTASYQEKAKSSSRELSAGAGFEFFFVQNYTLTFEGGFRRLEFNRFDYRDDGTDLAGTARAKGDALVDTAGNNRKLDLTGGYFNVGLSIHL